MENNNFKKTGFFLSGNNDKAVLLIHGITGTPSEMHYLGRKINKAGFTVLCNILPRHCDSLQELKKVTWNEMADACAQDIERLKKEYSRVFVVGLSAGALLGIHLAYKFGASISGVVALAPTVFYDGWALHKGEPLMHILWHIPFFRNNIDIREDWPHGLKDEYLRNKVHNFYASAKVNKTDEKSFVFGSPFFPMACLYQHHIFVKVVKKELPFVKNPIFVIHAREDDMTSPKNAHYILKNIGSTDKSLLILDDSYHMITIDQQKEKVAEETVKFLSKFLPI